MKKIKTNYLILLYFLCASVLAFAQTEVLDSLKKELQLHQKPTIARVDILYQLAYQSHRNNIDKTILYNKEAETISNEIGYTKGKGQVLSIKGILEITKANYNESAVFFKQALEIFKELDYKKGIASCYSNIGITHYYQAEFQAAIGYFEKSLAVQEELGDRIGMAGMIDLLGATYSEIGEYPKAIEFHKKAQKIYKEEKDEVSFVGSLNNLGAIYLEQGNYPLAYECYNEYLDVSLKNNDESAVSKAYNNLGILYGNQEKNEKALESYGKSLEYNVKVNNLKNIAILKCNMGTIYRHQKEYQKSFEYQRAALKISQQINDKDQCSNSLNNLGDLYMVLKQYKTAYLKFQEALKIDQEIGDRRGESNSYLGITSSLLKQKKYKEALVTGLKSQAISSELDLLRPQRNIHELLAEIYKGLGDYKNALSNYEQFKVLNDSLFNKENIEKITQLEYEYKYKHQLESADIREKKLNQTVKNTSEDLERFEQKYLWAIIISLIGAMLLGAIIFYLRLRNVKSESQTIIIEQKLLRSQMTPHFIFNSLSVLQGMILNKEEDKSVEYLSKFSKLLRIILENSRDKIVSLPDELAAIENYLALQNLENDSYESSIEVDNNIDVSLFKVPPMLIQPFVENAIEHAFVHHTEKKIIDVHLAYTNGELVCTIADNGIGIDFIKETKNQHKISLSTTITNERLKLLSKDFKAEGSIRIEDRKKFKEQGTIVTIVIPHKIETSK